MSKDGPSIEHRRHQEIVGLLREIRDLLQEMDEAAVFGPLNASAERQDDMYREEPQRDPLFDKAVEVIRAECKKGDVISARRLYDIIPDFESFGRARSVFEQLIDAGVISRPERGKAARVLRDPNDES